MKTAAISLLMLGLSFVCDTAMAAPSNVCKLCKEDYDACVKAHTKLACKTNMDICINHCRPASAPKASTGAKQ